MPGLLCEASVRPHAPSADCPLGVVPAPLPSANSSLLALSRLSSLALATLSLCGDSLRRRLSRMRAGWLDGSDTVALVLCCLAPPFIVYRKRGFGVDLVL